MSTWQSTLNKTILNTELREEVKQDYFWDMFTGISQQSKAGKWIPSGSPIERFMGFKVTGRNNTVLPMIRNVFGYGRVGKAPLVSHEKELSYLYFKLWIHLLRFGVLPPNQVDAEIMAWADMANAVKKQLVNWWAGYLNHDVTRAYLEGYSKHITDAVVDEGLGITKQYPKNFWVYDDGGKDFSNSPTYTYNQTTYKAAIIDKLKAAPTAADVFNVDTLEALPPLISYSNITPWTVDGEKVYVLIINSRQMKTLRQDSEWQNAVARAANRGKTNPIFKYAVAYWGKFIIYVDDVVARIAYACDDTSEVLNFFDYDAGVLQADSVGMYAKVQSPDPTEDQNYACALLLGQSSMAEGLFSDLKYAEEKLDYSMITGIGSSRYYAYARMDYFDEELTTVGTAQQNPQMAVIATVVS